MIGGQEADAVMVQSLPVNMLEHAAGHREATEHVDAGEQGGEEASSRTARLSRRPAGAADQDDPGDRVGHRHQRRVQRVVHVADHVVAVDDRPARNGEVA